MNIPLAQRLRPRNLGEVCGQSHILGADKVLRRMVEAVKTGAFSAYLPFNRDGQPVRLG